MRNLGVRLSLLQKFLILGVVSALAITVVLCEVAGGFLRHYLVAHDAAMVGEHAFLLVRQSIAETAFTQASTPDLSLFERRIGPFARDERIVRVILYGATARVLWSDDASLVGRDFGHHAAVGAALRGTSTARIVRPDQEDHQQALAALGRLEEIYLPVRYRHDGPVVGVLELYRSPRPFFAVLDRGLLIIWGLGVAGALCLYLALFGIVRNSARTQQRLDAQQAAYARDLEVRVEERTQELSRRATAVGTLYTISRALAQSLETHEILDRALDELINTEAGDGVWISLLPADAGGTPLVASRGVPGELLQRSATQAASVATSGQALLLEDGACRGSLLAPIFVGDRSQGTLGIARRDARRFTADEIQLLGAVARQIGVAIGKAQQYAAARERERETRILYETTRHFAEQRDPDALLSAILEGAVAIVRGAWGGVGFPEGEEIVIRRRLTSGTPGPAMIRHKIAQSLAGFTYLSGKPQMTNDPAEDPRTNHEAARALGVRGMVCSPLQIHGRVVGVLFVSNKESGAFTERDLVLLTAFANHAAVALEHVRLQAETLKREREAFILFRTGTRLHGQTDLEALLTTIIEGAIEITNAGAGAIGRLVDGEIVLRPLVGFSLPPAQGEIRLPVADSTAGLTYATGESVIVNDLERSACAPPVRKAARGYGIRTFLCAPLQTQKKTNVGVIKVCNKKDEAVFTDDDLRLLTTFATHAAMAIENAALLHDTKATKEYLENLIESSVDGIVTLSPRATVTFFSQGARRMFRYREDDVVAWSARAYWTAGARNFRAFRRLLVDQGRVENYETELRTASGAVLAVNISASLLRGPDGTVTGTLAVIRDVTTQRQLHEQIVSWERLASAGLLAAGVAHEIGNPLTCISSLTQVLRARVSDPAIQGGLEDIEAHAGRIVRIVQDLGQLARPAPLEIRESSLEELVENAVHLARHNPTARTMKIETTFGANLPRLRVAADHLLQVFLNIILNAADAGGDLTIRGVASEDGVRVSFTDTGHGMGSEELRRLFDPFYSTKRSDQHMGLGLFVSHEIVRQHRGTLRAESQPGRGCTVTVTLPVERPSMVPEVSA
jgi:PAS domain S-box-containing protein